jgi:hypothetical protein
MHPSFLPSFILYMETVRELPDVVQVFLSAKISFIKLKNSEKEKEKRTSRCCPEILPLFL